LASITGSVLAFSEAKRQTKAQKPQCDSGDAKCLQAVKYGESYEKLLESRQDIITGGLYTQDASASVKLIDEELTSIAKKFFRKREDSKTWRIEYIPKTVKAKQYETKQDIFTFFKGPVAKPYDSFRGLAGFRYPGVILNEPGLPSISQAGAETAVIIVKKEPAMADNIDYQAQPIDPCCRAERGLHYRSPGSAVVVIEKGNKVLAHQRVTVAQFGRVLWLPADLGGLGIEQDISIYPATGALKMVSLTSKGVDPSKISEVSGAVTPLLEKIGQRKSDEQKELDQLNTEASIWKARKEIKEYKDALGVE